MPELPAPLLLQDFAFLFTPQCEAHQYYRWRVFSLAQGDLLTRWRTEPFVMISGGSLWIPPRVEDLPAPAPSDRAARAPAEALTEAAGGRGTASANERELSERQRDEFEDMLRLLTVDRASIREAMAFALDNAEAAGEVAETLAEALSLAETPVPTKVARLFLLSDILHNSSAQVRNASAYRTHLAARLPDVFESLADTFRCVDGRISAEAMKKHVLVVLRCWGDWFLFSDAFLRGLQSTFLRKDARLDGLLPHHPLRAELAALSAEELERRCRHNGLASSGGQEACISRLAWLDVFLHGEPESQAEKGQLARDETTNVPLARPDSKAAVVASRWTTSDWDGEESSGGHRDHQELASSHAGTKRCRSPSSPVGGGGGGARPTMIVLRNRSFVVRSCGCVLLLLLYARARGCSERKRNDGRRSTTRHYRDHRSSSSINRYVMIITIDR